MNKGKYANRGRGPEPVSVLMGLTVAWNMYGFAHNFFERAWPDAPIPARRWAPSGASPPSPGGRSAWATTPPRSPCVSWAWGRPELRLRRCLYFTYYPLLVP